LAVRLKELFALKGKENQGTRTDICQKSDKCLEPIDTKKELAKIADLSHDTISKVEHIEKSATPEVKQAIRDKKVSINTASTIVELPKEEQTQVITLSEEEILKKAKEIRETKKIASLIYKFYVEMFQNSYKCETVSHLENFKKSTLLLLSSKSSRNRNRQRLNRCQRTHRSWKVC
jgi:transcriptional regulator with XRE-family HTH domain